MRKFFFLFLILGSFSVVAQVDTPDDDDDDFDFSEFELAAPAAKSFCTNKVLGQTPTTLIGVNYDYQLPHDLTIMPGAGDFTNSDLSISPAEAVNVQGNFPLISRNNILVNMNIIYQHQGYNLKGSGAHPFAQTLDRYGLNRSALMFTVFKPLNEKNFILAQVGAELNGDYAFSDFESAASTIRVPAAVLYGWKPHDRLMYAFGLARTYLGGSLNYVPVIYYYHTFRNQKWGIEALLPSRGSIRYRFNSLTLLSMGFSAVGATYRLNSFEGFAADFAPPAQGQLPVFGAALQNARDVELRRSELRLGFSFQRAIVGFFWLNIDAGYRINWSYDIDEGGDFLRFFGDDRPYFIENDLRNTPYFSIGISYTSP